MIDPQHRRGLFASAVLTLALALVPTASFAFPQSTETTGEITPDLGGTWLVVHRLEFPKTAPVASPSPAAAEDTAAKPATAGTRPFTVANVFKIAHLGTADAQKARDAEKAKQEAAIEKATKILAEEQKKAAANPKPVASGELPVESKVLSYRVPRAPDSAADLHDEVTVSLLDVELPKAIQDTIDAANQAEKAWDPAEKDLATLKSSWKALQPRAKTEYARIQWKVLQDKYLEAGMLQDEQTKNAKFVISGDASLLASAGQANRSILVYGAEQVSDRLIEGGHVRAIMTAAPFPIPIDMKGRFKMYRLTDPPKTEANKEK